MSGKLKLIKENVTYKKCAQEIKSLLADAGFQITNERDFVNHHQLKLNYNSEFAGHIRFYSKKDKHTTIDDSQIVQKYKEKVRAALQGYVNFEALEKGTVPLGTRNISDASLLNEIKNLLHDKFPELKDTGVKNQIVEYRLLGNKLIVQQFRAGSILFQGKSTAYSDKVIKEIDKLIATFQRSILLERIREQVTKEDYTEIEKALQNRQIKLTEYVSEKIYFLLSGCGSHLLHDGLTIFQIIKEQKVKLKDYGSVLRNFSILFEDFLINWFIRLGEIKEDDIQTDPRFSFIGKLISQNSVLASKYKPCYIRTRPKFVEKLSSVYQECRHDLLHSDKFKYEPIDSFQKAEAKFRNIISCMEDCVNLFEKELSLPQNTNIVTDIYHKILGIDESGKGDLFGPLVISGVLIETHEIEKRLREIGVQDSKNLSDSKAIYLAEEIKKLCAFTTVKINPEKYNELYTEMRNLNKLLGWGHARVIENILQTKCPDYAISDKFGDESFINSKLMEKGKKIKLIQKVKAEENMAVAAASVIARATFLLSLDKMSNHYTMNFPKGATSEVIDSGKDFIERHGKENLKKVAKIHFKTSQQIIDQFQK